ncbi:transketolase [Chromobacterium subtsugae]|uniref:Transketolase n=1 Tax=Chromobacterium subtsugae TaxID=251747 RepID=A0ABS7FGS2_9NEIS|nr:MULTISPECIES: transketolase [Chromobacterium]KUM03992.1 transketolase [Chromobacterium subtsugae]KZE86452.1 transketolase [Chromobacterium sp. F49]MBW7567720.1 transketolase [Chromobacterium subtsugae]MBW8288946.1 transketolase [Chromobacterium subtsugae]WSE91261.1 transketolase [Chromobacterium subtsugae]
MRNAFIDELVKLAAVHPDIVLMVGDLGYGVVEPFAERFPDRFINAGIAEQNMMGMAAGMASEGCHVFTYSIANFPTFRCAEQIRNDVDYHNLAVTVVSVGGGLAYGNLGYSHHAVQDYGLMRMMPNMTIAAPGDPMEVRACLRYLASHPGPSYLRLGKAGEPCLHPQVPDVVPGQWLPIRQRDSAAALLTTGAAVSSAIEWLDTPDFAAHSLYTMPLWGMAAKQKQPQQLSDWDLVVTVEDHIHDAGFGSWLMEAAAPAGMSGKIRNRALSTEIFGKVGSQKTLNKLGGL